jgi:hypothetical protein
MQNFLNLKFYNMLSNQNQVHNELIMNDWTISKSIWKIVVKIIVHNIQIWKFRSLVFFLIMGI